MIHRSSCSTLSNDFSIVIQIGGKFYSTLIQIVVKLSLWNFAHGTTAVLSWHVQNCITIWYPTLKLHPNQFSIEFGLQRKSCTWKGPQASMSSGTWFHCFIPCLFKCMLGLMTKKWPKNYMTVLGLNSLRPSDASVNLATIGSDNGLSPVQCQAIIQTNIGLLLIEPLGTNFSKISVEINQFSYFKMHLKMSSAKWWPYCICLNVLILDHPNWVAVIWRHFHGIFSLDSWRCGRNFKSVIFKLISRMDILGIFREVAVGWMPHGYTDD